MGLLPLCVLCSLHVHTQTLTRDLLPLCRLWLSLSVSQFVCFFFFFFLILFPSSRFGRWNWDAGLMKLVKAKFVCVSVCMCQIERERCRCASVKIAQKKKKKSHERCVWCARTSAKLSAQSHTLSLSLLHALSHTHTHTFWKVKPPRTWIYGHGYVFRSFYLSVSLCRPLSSLSMNALTQYFTVKPSKFNVKSFSSGESSSVVNWPDSR